MKSLVHFLIVAQIAIFAGCRSHYDIQSSLPESVGKGKVMVESKGGSVTYFDKITQESGTYYGYKHSRKYVIDQNNQYSYYIYGSTNDISGIYLVKVELVDKRKVKGVIWALTDSTIFVSSISSAEARRIMETYSSPAEFRGTEIHCSNIRSISIRKDGEVLKGMGNGFLIGAATGMAVGIATNSADGYFFSKPIEAGAFTGALFGTAGMIIGGVAGAGSSKFEIQGLYDKFNNFADIYGPYSIKSHESKSYFKPNPPDL